LKVRATTHASLLDAIANACGYFTNGMAH
jgi:hypothetical protein